MAALSTGKTTCGRSGGGSVGLLGPDLVAGLLGVSLAALADFSLLEYCQSAAELACSNSRRGLVPELQGREQFAEGCLEGLHGGLRCLHRLLGRLLRVLGLLQFYEDGAEHTQTHEHLLGRLAHYLLVARYALILFESVAGAGEVLEDLGDTPERPVPPEIGIFVAVLV